MNTINGSRRLLHSSDQLTGILLDQTRTLGRIEGRLDSHIDDTAHRFDRLESKRPERRLPELKDLLPYLYGVAILAAAAAGKITWESVPEWLKLGG